MKIPVVREDEAKRGYVAADHLIETVKNRATTLAIAKKAAADAASEPDTLYVFVVEEGREPGRRGAKPARRFLPVRVIQRPGTTKGTNDDN